MSKNYFKKSSWIQIIVCIRMFYKKKTLLTSNILYVAANGNISNIKFGRNIFVCSRKCVCYRSNAFLYLFRFGIKYNRHAVWEYSCCFGIVLLPSYPEIYGHLMALLSNSRVCFGNEI